MCDLSCVVWYVWHDVVCVLVVCVVFVCDCACAVVHVYFVCDLMCDVG